MTTRFGSLTLVALAAALSACSGSRRAAPPAPPSSGLEALEPLPPLPPLEPLACALHAGRGRPDDAAEDAACVVKYLRAAEAYLAQGGKPSAHTTARQLEWWRMKARELNAEVAASLTGERPQAAPPEPAAPPAPSAEEVSRESEQHYLSGIIYFQKGDYAKAGDEWRLALAKSPANIDARAGLDRLRKLGVP